MKGFGFAFLCVVATVSGLSTGVQPSSQTEAARGENPWLVHLRVAVADSGLQSCTGVLVTHVRVLTTATCLENSRYVWIRFGAVNVVRPSLVVESVRTQNHPTVDLTFLVVGRFIDTTANFGRVTLSSSVTVPESANFCTYGTREDGAAGEILRCSNVTLESKEDGTIVAHSDFKTTRYDIGTPLVKDGVLVGVLTTPASEDNAGVFINPVLYRDWMEEIGFVEFSD